MIQMIRREKTEENHYKTDTAEMNTSQSSGSKDTCDGIQRDAVWEKCYKASIEERGSDYQVDRKSVV